MNLLEFVEKNNIPTTNKIITDKTDFEILRDDLEKIVKSLTDIPSIDSETDEIIRFSGELRIKVELKKLKSRKNKIIYNVIRELKFNKDGFNWFDVVETKTKEEALSFLYSEFYFDNFLKYNNIFFDGRYLRDFEFKKVIYVDGKIKRVD